MGNYRGNLDDVVNSSYVAGSKTVGTAQVLAAVGASNLAGREEVNIYNGSSATIWIGPTGVTVGPGTGSIPIGPQESVTFQYGAAIQIYMIAATAGNVIDVQEAG